MTSLPCGDAYLEQRLDTEVQIILNSFISLKICCNSKIFFLTVQDATP